MAKKKSSNKLLYILGGVVALLIVVAIIAKSTGALGDRNSTSVTVAGSSLESITETVSASGTIQPEVEVKISPDVPGEIIELHVEEGDSVRVEDLLIKIRPDNFQSALERSMANLNQQRANQASSEARLSQAEAEFVRAQKEFERNNTLYTEKVISDSEYEAAQASFTVAQQELESARQGAQAARYTVASSRASVNEAQENLSLTSVFAPMNGIVSKLSVEKGERVVGTSQMAGTEMLRIADLNRMEVRVDVNENDIIRVSVGDTAIIDVDAYSYSGKKFKGLVTQIANTAKDKVSEDAVTEFEVRVRVLNESYTDLLEEKGTSPFRPGMTASVDIITMQKNDVLTVPLSAVTTRESEESEKQANAGGEDEEEVDRELDEVVFVIEEGKAKKILVETGISDFDNIEIISGISEGQEVITGPFLEVSKNLEDGASVKAQEQDKKEDD